MKKLTISFLLSMLFVVTYGQDVELLVQGNTLQRVGINVPFHFIHNKIDTAKLAFIGTFRAYGNNNNGTIENLYNTIQKESKKSGANCFKLIKVTRAQGSRQAELILETYYADMPTLSANSDLKEKNVVYIFSSERKSTDKTTSFKVDNVKKELEGGKYLRYTLAPDGEIKISKGGMAGSSMTFTGEQNRTAIYVSLGGFGLAPGVSPPGGGVALSFNAGKVNRMDSAFGELLTNALERAE
ncbi:hypothetical protein [Pseudochryseolinea flava]|uniref:DUF4410 domain-containing protein n=1 Tax=Pseudochryseolinea flava TaxID=2059302 RepID=A0A364XXW1_9BACT|nr:hypothetical protein [Pseudochryseolinea flava]RAV98254.1 hypothetical protein DQQ10_24955 [Pseudochryseolinea flava]